MEINVRKSQVPPAADGTASWIWTHPVYASFSTERAGILWLRGKPGSGKSVLARSVQRKLLESSTAHGKRTPATLVGDWFYHRRQGGRFIRHESFVRSVLFHFLQQNSKLFPKFFQDVYRSAEPGNSTPWTYETLVDILTRVCYIGMPVVCIVDAVDEAESTEILQLINGLVDAEAGSRAKFIVLSRPNAHIEREIGGRLSIVVERENENDIARIIDMALVSLQKAIHSLDFEHAPRPPLQRLNRIPIRSNTRQPRYRSIAKAVGRENEAINEIRRILITKAQGSILWVKLVLDKLAHEVETNHGATLEELKEAVAQIPEELAEYYKQIRDDLIAKKSARRVQEIRQALMWIFAAPEIGDVTLEGLWEALAKLKDDFTSTSLDGIWEKKILIASYDELWRKLSSICGAFIEIFNPGFSAEESRAYHYGASSAVQLMHQSVRDFLCNPDAAGMLFFSMEEAKELVNRHLEHYLTLTQDDHCRMTAEGPQDPMAVVDWLNDQKLLRLAVKSARSKGLPLAPLIATREWHLEPPPACGAESDMISALQASSCITSGYFSGSAQGHTAIGRLIYHACTEGLPTAVRNMQLLGRFSFVDTMLVKCCLLFVASRVDSFNVKVGLDLPGLVNTSFERPALGAAGKSKPWTAVAIPSRLRYCETCSYDYFEAAKPETVLAEGGSRERRASDGSNMRMKELEFEEDGDDEQHETPHEIRMALRSETPSDRDPPSPNYGEDAVAKPSKLGAHDPEWVSFPWTAMLIVLEKGSMRANYRVPFQGWCSFLDFVCGSKKPRANTSRADPQMSGAHQVAEPGGRQVENYTGGKDAGAGLDHILEAGVPSQEGGESSRAPVEDVEEAILAAALLVTESRNNNDPRYHTRVSED